MNEQIAKAVQADDRISVSKNDEYRKTLNTRRLEIEAGIRRTMPPGHDPLTRMGSERLAATRAGDVERVKTLDDEFQALLAEQAQVNYLSERLREIRKETAVIDAVESMPEWLQQLGNECAAIVEAHKALEDAWTAADSTYTDILRGRMSAQARHKDVAGADDSVMRKIGNAMQCNGSGRMVLKRAASLPNQFASDMGYVPVKKAS